MVFTAPYLCVGIYPPCLCVGISPSMPVCGYLPLPSCVWIFKPPYLCVVFDRVRENLRKYKKKPLNEVLNISINETLSRTFMTSATTLLALISLFVLGGDVIRGFVFAMIWGVIIGTYSSIFVASAVLLYLGVKRDWSKPDANAGNQYANIDA